MINPTKPRPPIAAGQEIVKRVHRVGKEKAYTHYSFKGANGRTFLCAADTLSEARSYRNAWLIDPKIRHAAIDIRKVKTP